MLLSTLVVLSLTQPSAPGSLEADGGTGAPAQADSIAESDGGVGWSAAPPPSPAESRRQFGTLGVLRPRTLRAPVSVAVLTEAGVQPMSLLGAELSARLGGERCSLLVSSWTILPTTLAVSDTSSVNVFSMGGMMGACVELPLFAGLVVGCVAGRGGVLYSQARHTSLRSPSWQPMVTAGLRVAAEWPADTTIAFSVAAHAWVPILRPQVTTNETSWAQPWIHGGGSIGLVARLW